MSDAARERQRLIPAPIALAFGALVAVALALLFPFRGLETQIGRDGPRPDALQIAYLEAWLTVRPQRAQLRYVLAHKLVHDGQYERAQEHLGQLAAGDDPRLRSRAELLAIDIGLRQLAPLAPDDPQREARATELRARLAALLARSDLPAEVGLLLAQRAAALGAGAVVNDWYARLLRQAPPLPAAHWEDGARLLLAAGEHRLAARLFLQASLAAPAAGERRRLFLQALRTLQAASLFDEALALADAHFETYAADTEVLEFLTRLALAADRPEAAQRYAIALLRISLLPAALERWRTVGLAPPPEWLALHARIAPRLRPVQVELDHERTARLPFDHELYALSFQVFVANGNLRDALVVARAAVRQVPRDLRWRRKLAQVADWAGQPQLALEQWQAIARAGGRAADWAEVRSRARALGAHEARLEALRAALAHAPGDPGALQELLAIYEALGQPERAIELLRAELAAPLPAAAATRRALLESLAAIAEGSGDLEAQRAALAALLREYGAPPEIARRLAWFEYGLGDKEAAYAALAAARPRAQKDVSAHAAFWSDYAQLARATGRGDEALRAWRLLLDAGVADTATLTALAAAIADDDPREAARLYDLAWQRDRAADDLALRALALWLRAGDRDAARAWLARATPQQIARLQKDAQFLVQRALLHLADGAARAAAADLRRAHALRPRDAGIEATLVWTLIAARDAPALRAHLAAAPPPQASAPPLRGALGAGWLALHEPRRALAYLRAQADGGEPLWQLAYADALEQLGHGDAAWGLRRQAWLGHAALPAPASEDERLARQRRLAPLAAMMAEGEVARAHLHALLAADPQPRKSPTREAAAAYWITRGDADLAEAWLVAGYAQALARPAWADLSSALAHGDRERLARLLETMADWLPRHDRIEAAVRLGQAAQAQSLAFAALAAAPDNDDTHRRLVELATDERAGAAPPRAGLGWRSLRHSPVAETEWSAEGSAAIAPRLRLGVAVARIERDSVDPQQLADPPRHDRSERLDFGFDCGTACNVGLSLHWRESLARSHGWRLDGRWQPHRRLTAEVGVGQGQSATDNALLRVGAERDLARVGLYARLAQREFAALSYEAARLHAQGGGAIGRARALRLEVGHDLRLDYPDLSLRLGASDLRYEAEPGVAQPLLALLPAAARATASNVQLLPEPTRQIGLMLAAGASARDRYTRAWRPYALLGVHVSDPGETGFTWTVGARGRLLGADQLLLEAAGGDAPGTRAESFRSLALRYRWLF